MIESVLIGALLYSGYFINLTSNHNLIFPPHPAILSPLLHRIIKTQNLPTSGQEVTSSRLIKVTVYSKTEHLSPAPNSPQFSHQRTKTLISRASEDSQDEQTARSRRENSSEGTCHEFRIGRERSGTKGGLATYTHMCKRGCVRALSERMHACSL